MMVWLLFYLLVIPSSSQSIQVEYVWDVCDGAVEPPAYSTFVFHYHKSLSGRLLLILYLQLPLIRWALQVSARRQEKIFCVSSQA